MFHCSVKPITRGKGQSSVASAAYRSAEKLTDERLDKTFNYTRKEQVLKTQIYGYKGSRSQLWNSAEKAEKRKDSLVAREIEINLPNRNDRVGEMIVDKLAEWLVEKYQVAVDAAIHWNADRTSKHAHLMITGRPVKNETFAAKKDRGWDANPGRERVNEIRTRVSEIIQEHVFEFERKNWDHRSYENRGINKEPQPKMTPQRLKYRPEMRQIVRDRNKGILEPQIKAKPVQAKIRPQIGIENTIINEPEELLPEPPKRNFEIGINLPAPKKVKKRRKGRGI